jgi:hypothetical protein
MEQKIINAGFLGAIAFKEGKPRVPALDANLMQEIKGLQNGEGLPLLNMWLQQWDLANLMNN